MKFPWNETSDPLALQPGNYYVEITDCKEKQSKNGNPMWELTLKAIAFNTKLCHDRFMLSGGGVNISAAKLSALGFAKEDDVEYQHLLGKRCWVSVLEKPAEGEYKRRLEIDIGAKGFKCGYTSEKPLDVVEPTVKASDEPPW